MNLPNKLTTSRFFLAGILTALLLSYQPYTKTASLFVFIAAMITDYLDGKMARKLKLQSHFGILMDPLADKVLTCAAFICFLDMGSLGRFLPWAVIIIITREFLITGLRLLAGTRQKILPADKLGKHKTAWQMITIMVILIKLSLDEWISTAPDDIPESPLDSTFYWIIQACLGITVILTVYSGSAYFWKNRDLLKETG